MSTKQTQLRVESLVKDKFQQACRNRNSSMTAEVVRFMKHFVDQNYKDEKIIKELDVLDTQRRTGMIRDSKGTWISRDEYYLLKSFDDL
jgi:hypothetical protein